METLEPRHARTTIGDGGGGLSHRRPWDPLLLPPRRITQTNIFGAGGGGGGLSSGKKTNWSQTLPPETVKSEDNGIYYIRIYTRKHNTYKHVLYNIIYITIVFYYYYYVCRKRI